MVKSILLFFSTFSIFANVENKPYQGVVRDLATNEPIPFVSISIENSSIGTVTNENGDYRITAPENAVIVLSHINYKTYKMQFAGSSPQDLYLEPVNYALEEVIITSKPLKEIMLDVIKNSKTMLKKDIILETYSRELVKINGIHTRFADALLSCHVEKNPKNPNLYIEQSRSSNLENNSQYSEIENTLLNVDYKDIIEKAYTFENIANLLNNTFFETTLKSMESSDRTYHLLLIVPVDKTKNSYETKVIFDMEKKLILNVEYLYGDTNLYEIPEVNNIYYKYKYVDYRHTVSLHGYRRNHHPKVLKKLSSSKQTAYRV